MNRCFGGTNEEMGLVKHEEPPEFKQAESQEISKGGS